MPAGSAEGGEAGEKEADAVEETCSNEVEPAPSPAPRANAAEVTGPRTSWAGLVRAPSLESLPSVFKSRFEKSLATLREKGFFARQANSPLERPKPVPIPVYFGGVPRGRIGQLRRALFAYLPRRAVLSFSFIGNYACEILCHKPLEATLIAGMKLLGFRHIQGSDPTRPIGLNTEESTRKSLVACYRRWT